MDYYIYILCIMWNNTSLEHSPHVSFDRVCIMYCCMSMYYGLTHVWQVGVTGWSEPVWGSYMGDRLEWQDGVDLYWASTCVTSCSDRMEWTCIGLLHHRWWRDLFKCRIDLLNFSMGFNMIAHYMEFLHLNWYIAEWHDRLEWQDGVELY